MLDLKKIGMKIGHFTDIDNGTGCSVFMFDGLAKAVFSAKGYAPASHETEIVKPGKLLQTINAICLSGGSAYGLEAASGVMQYLEEQGIGYDTGVALVPIVPAASIYDLKYKNFSVRPTKEWGYQAAKNASYSMQKGSIGAACGATVGKFLGIEYATKTGFGFCFEEFDLGFVAVFSVVNALGEIVNDKGEIIAGVKGEKDFIPASEILSQLTPEYFRRGENTTLIVAVTNYPLSKDMLMGMAYAAHNGIVRAVRPSHTPFDGDSVFAVTLSEDCPDHNPYEIMKLFYTVEMATKKAIQNSVLREEKR